MKTIFPVIARSPLRSYGGRRSNLRDCFATLAMTILCGLFLSLFPLQASEVIEQTQTQVIVRDHGKTGKPYVSITSAYADSSVNPVAAGYQPKSRPDYRMLDHHMKSGQIPYDGPSSDRKKVYILAASLATAGVAGGVIGVAVAPAAASAAGAGATGGAGAYAFGGGAIAAGTISTAVLQSQPDPHKDDYDHKSESREISETTDSLR